MKTKIPEYQDRYIDERPDQGLLNEIAYLQTGVTYEENCLLSGFRVDMSHRPKQRLVEYNKRIAFLRSVLDERKVRQERLKNFSPVDLD